MGFQWSSLCQKRGRDQLHPQPCGKNDNFTDNILDLYLTGTHNTPDKANAHHRTLEMSIENYRRKQRWKRVTDFKFWEKSLNCVKSSISCCLPHSSDTFPAFFHLPNSSFMFLISYLVTQMGILNFVPKVSISRQNANSF